MLSKHELIKPSASDFGSYVYCGAKLFRDKIPALDSFRKAKHDSYDLSSKKISLLRGQQNEHRCIEWILRKHKGHQNIVFDGTGKDNQQTFPAKINNEILQCRPDLILRRDNQTILYEFKAVSDSRYLLYSEYDSIHAQVWCYKFIEHFKIDKYLLFRYHEDPFMWNVFPKETELTEEKMSDDKFIPLFGRYLNIIKIINKGNSLSKKELDFIDSNRPVNQPDKCHYCIYYSIYCNPQCEVKK